MSLVRQIIILLSLALLVVFAGSLAVSVYHARSYLDQQLGAHAQDTATSLGLSLGQPLANADYATIKSMASAIADRGYYHYITVEKMDGTVLFERKTPVVVEDIPAWFVRWLPLRTPLREAVVMEGWKQGGKVMVSSHPGYAYQQLWDAARGMFWWLIGSWALAVALVITLVRFALSPLSTMERQAISISAGEFPVIDRLPWARELRRVAAAMNMMSAKVEQLLGDKINIIDRLEKEAHLDPLTGLYNRTCFEGHLASLMADGEEFETGALVLVRLTGLSRINTRHGYEIGDEILLQTSFVLRKLSAELQHAMVARISGAELVLMVQEISPDEALALAERLLGKLHHFWISSGQDILLEKAHIGVGYRDRAVNTPGKLFAEADTALSMAQSQGNFGYAFYPHSFSGNRQIHGAVEWRKILEQVLEQRNLVLYAQPVMDAVSGEVLHEEILARIPDWNGDLVAAGVFMPMAHRLGLAIELDRLVVETVLARLNGAGAAIALNLSTDAVTGIDFPSWLHQALTAKPGIAGRLILQLPEHLVSDSPGRVGEFIALMKSAGCRYGFSHVGVLPGTLLKIKQFRPFLIKADASCTLWLEQGKEKHMLLEMLRDLARGMGSLLVVSAVETELQLSQLRKLGLVAAQGKLLAPPREMEPR